MKRFKLHFRIFFLLAITVAFLSLTSQAASSKFYIFQTTDIHVHLDNAKSKYSGGWLKLENVLEKEIKKVGGHKNCLLIDCGDTFQGTMEGTDTKGAIAVPLLNNAKYDVFVPGNHDFEFGLKNFLNRIQGINADILAANLTIKPHSDKEILPWKTYTKNGVKIVIIGMTSPYSKYWMCGDGINDYSLASITDSLGRVMPAVLKTKPDIIVLAMHHGLYNSKRFLGKDTFLYNIIKKYPQIDIVLGGHTHVDYPGTIVYNNTIYVQSGCYGQYLAKLEIDYDKSGKKRPLIKTELIPVSSKEKPDKEFENIAAKVIKQTKDKKKTVIGKTDVPIKNMNRLLAQAISHAVKVDAVMCRGVNGYTLRRGNITYGDIFKICSFDDKIVTVTLTLPELKKILKEQINFKDKYRKRLDLYQVVQGQVKMVSLNTKDLSSLFKGKKRIKVALTAYNAASAGNRFPVLGEIAKKTTSQLSDPAISQREALDCYVKDTFPL